MRTNKPLLLSTVTLAMLCFSALADTLTLKSGEKIEGKITGDTPTDYTIAVKVSAGITDTRTVAKTDVAKVDKEQPDTIAWQPLKNLKLSANSLPAASYDQITNALKGFMTQYPASANYADAQKLSAEFEAEKKRVAGGEVKLNGKWLSKEEAQKERYQINALLASNHMRDQSTRGDLIGALNTFDLIETQYPGARVYPDAVELARRVLASLKQDVDRRLPAVTQELEQRRRAIDVAPDAQRTELIAQQQREDAAADAALAAADRQRLKWPPLLARNERSLSSLQGRIPGEQQRLNDVDVAKIRRSIQLAEQARESFTKKEFDAAEKTVRQAGDLWYANELTARLQQEIVDARNAPATSPEAPGPTEPGQPAAGSKPGAATTAEGTASADEGVDSGEEPQKPFFLRPIGAITVILVVILVAAAVSIYKKIKGRASDVLE